MNSRIEIIARMVPHSSDKKSAYFADRLTAELTSQVTGRTGTLEDYPALKQDSFYFRLKRAGELGSISLDKNISLASLKE